MKYNASRGGHAPGHLREAFVLWLEDHQAYEDCPLDEDVSGYVQDSEGKSWSLCSLLGQLWNCTDIMGSEYCAILEVPQGSTVAQGVRKLKSELGD